MTITKHASVRMQQRNVAPKNIEQAITFGRKHYVNGYIIYVLGKREIARHGDLGELSLLNGLHVVATHHGEVVTTYRSTKLSRKTLANKRPFKFRRRRRTAQR